jgi:hypothetical protein
MTITTSGTTLTFNDGTTMTTVVFPSGTAMLFQQTAAPTGWTKSTLYNDYAIRIVNGTASTGGSVAFTTAFKSQSVTGTNSGGSVSATSLSTAQLASHNHSINIGSSCSCQSDFTYRSCCVGRTKNTNATGCGNSHSHGFTNPTFTGNAINLAVQYVDHIIATKN